MKRKYLSLFAVPAIIFTACDTPNYDDLVPSQYNTVLLLKETGEQGVTLYDTGMMERMPLPSLNQVS